MAFFTNFTHPPLMTVSTVSRAMKRLMDTLKPLHYHDEPLKKQIILYEF